MQVLIDSLKSVPRKERIGMITVAAISLPIAYVIYCLGWIATR